MMFLILLIYCVSKNIKIQNLNIIFAECYSLKELPDISNWFNIENLTIEYPTFTDVTKKSNSEFIFICNEKDENTGLCFSYMFYNCSSLKNLPNISKWKINNIIYIEGLFSGCSSLVSIPDIFIFNSITRYFKMEYKQC